MIRGTQEGQTYDEQANPDDNGFDDDEEEEEEESDEDEDDDEEDEDDEEDADVREQSEEYIEGGGEVHQQFKRVEYEALAEKKRKALLDSQGEGPAEKAKQDINIMTGIDGIMEAMYYGFRRKSRKRRNRGRGRRKVAGRKLNPAISQMLGDATLHYAHGRYKEAISVLDRVIRLAPDLSDAYHTLGLVHNALGNTNLAMEAYKIAAGIKRQDSSLWKLLFSWSIEQGDMASARIYVSKAVRAEPQDISLRVHHASLCLEAGKYKKAAESYEQLFRLCPENVEALKTAAKLYVKCGEGEQSASILEEYLRSHVSEAGEDMIDFLAMVLMKTNAYSRALKHIQDVQHIYHPGKTLSLNLKLRAAICLIHLQQNEQAEELLSVLPQESVSDHAKLITEVADTYMDLGNFCSALKYYHIVESDAGEVNVGYLHLRMASCYLSLKERSQAITFFFKVLHELEDNIDARLTLAALLLEDAKENEAISVLAPPKNSGQNDDKLRAWWHNRRVRMKLCQVYLSLAMLEGFVDTALPLVLEWVWRKVKGKRKRSIDMTGEALEDQQTESARSRKRKASASKQLKAGVTKRQRRMRATLNETKKIKERVAIIDPSSDGPDDDSSQDVIEDEEYHNLFIDLCKALTSLQRYWEALEIINLAQRLERKILPAEKKKELRSLGAQISCDTRDPKQWFDCIRSVLHQHPYRLVAWNCFYRVILRFGKRFSSEAKFVHYMRTKYKDCVPPILIAGHQFTMTSRHQDAAREYLEAYKLLPENPLINLCVGTALINLALGFRLQNRHQCLVQGFAFLYNNLRLSENSQEAMYNLARAYHHVGLVTLAASYYEKVLSMHVKDHPVPKLPNEDPSALDDRRTVRCDLRREAAFNLHLIYRNSGAQDLARQVLKDHCML